jgi:hypothetical protein
MIAAPWLDAIGAGNFEAKAVYCDEVPNTRDGCKRKRRRGVTSTALRSFGS